MFEIRARLNTGANDDDALNRITCIVRNASHYGRHVGASYCLSAASIKMCFFSRVLLLLSNFVTKAVTGSLLIAD